MSASTLKIYAWNICADMFNKFGGIAQLEERALCKREAPGSKPGISKFYRSISLEVRTPRCGRGNPGSNPGSSINFFFFISLRHQHTV